MNLHYSAVAARAEHRCEYCRAPETIANLAFEVEHIVPVSKGGADHIENLALACRSCNLYKSDVLAAPDPETTENVRLFHPRHDIWDSHFVIDSATGEIHGLSPCGRATAHLLKMGGEYQRSARRLWLRLGIL